MRTAKCTLLILCLALALSACGGKKDEPDAAASMKKNKLVRILTYAVNLPFEFGSGTGVQGFDVDIGEQVGKDLGYEVKWVKSPSYDKLFELLKNGEAEYIISAVPILPEYKKDFAFSRPYFETTLTIARRQVTPEIKDLASLSGKKVGVQASTAGDTFMATQKTASNVDLKKFPTVDDALGALNRGEINGVVGDQYILTYSIYKSFSHLETLDVKLDSEELGIVVRKKEKELLAKANETLERLKKSGEMDTLRNKWFGDVVNEVRKQREDRAKEEALKATPKSITLNLIKGAGASFNFDRLDGFQAQLVGDRGSFASSPIMTSGNRGSCRFDGIPPGEYRMVLSVFRTSTPPFQIPKVAARSLTFDMNIGSTIRIEQR